MSPWVKSGETSDFGLKNEGVLCSRGRVYVLKDTDLRQFILQEAHSSPYVMHLDENKMYHDLRELYWWPGLKRKVTNFVGKFLTCQQVKAEHQLPSGLHQPKLAKLYMSENIRLHGVPVSIISNRNPRFTFWFWKKLYEALGTSWTSGSWEHYFLLAEFAYNNSYQSSVWHLTRNCMVVDVVLLRAGLS
ncbi:uncharacterized protein LOC108465118 [Gossypium arboreum]|uniref:uncharacterized protein LOC108465118 n=1 Tax=Gossypium arboreum TaxID=29729 RepID=UPI0022F157AC|nr:uncharacterized protein LOC108465118 [Gossypium arboreum]